MKEIARTLSLTVKMISIHRARILIKMKLKNSAQLVRYAIKRSLVGCRTKSDNKIILSMIYKQNCLLYNLLPRDGASPKRQILCDYLSPTILKFFVPA